MQLHLEHWQSWVWSLGGIAGAVLLGIAVHSIIFRLLRRLARRTSSVFDDLLVQHGTRPAKVMFPLLGVIAVLPTLPIPPTIESELAHAVGLLLIGSVGWLLVAAVDFLRDLISERHTVAAPDNLSSRRIRTQVQVLRQVATSLIVMVTVAVMLMTFPSIRHLGESLFASAGLAALVVGLAARTALTNLLAGVQIALTQPIRLDDVVIVENEWGWIEEINPTYVVVRVWDLRRLIVPLSYFIEKPFQNWTRTTANLLGTVFIYTDYTVSVEEVRQEFHRILQASGMWDGGVWGLQVTNATDRSVELRALMSAPNGPRAFDLRCHVREKLIGFLQQRYPESLPKVRAEVSGLNSGNNSESQPNAA